MLIAMMVDPEAMMVTESLHESVSGPCRRWAVCVCGVSGQVRGIEVGSSDMCAGKLIKQRCHAA